MEEGPLTVLIVDDEPDHRELIRDALEHSSLTVDIAEAGNAAEALAELGRRPYQGVILDYMLPDGDALQLLPRILEAQPDLTVIVTTARGDEEIAAAAIRGGAADYVVKGANLAARLTLSLEQGLEAAGLRIRARQSEQHIAHLNSVLRAIRSVNQLITKEHDRNKLLQGVCDVLIAERGYEAAGVALVGDDGWPTDLFQAGLDAVEASLRRYIGAGHWPDYFLGARQNPGQLYVSPPHQRWPEPSDFDNRAVFFMAITYDGRVYGYLGAALAPELTDNPDERGLFTAMAGDLGFAMHNLDVEAERARGEQLISHLNAVLRAIRNVNQLITKERDHDRLAQGTCDLLISERGYEAVGIALVDEQQRPLGLFNAGFGPMQAQLRDHIEAGQWPEYVVGSMAHPDELFVSPPHQRGPEPDRLDAFTILCMGIRHDGKVYGYCGVALSPELADDVEERALFMELVGDLGFALHGLEMDSARVRAEEDLTQLNRLYQALIEISDVIVRVRDRDEILRQTCRIAVERAGLAMAWIGFLEPDGSVPPVAHWGHEDGYLTALHIDVNDPRFGRGPVGRSITEGRYVIADIAHDEMMEPWREEALKRGYRAVGAFPLRMSAQQGMFILYAAQPDFFDERRVQLLQTLAIDLGVALDALQHEEQRRQAEEALRSSEARLRLVIEKAPVGIVTRRGHKLLYVNPTMLQRLGYERMEDIPGQEVFSLYAPEVHDMMRQRIDARDAGEPVSPTYDIPCLTRDGQRLLTHLDVSKIELPDGPASVAFHTDLSARVQMEDDLRREIAERKQAQELLLVQQADLRLLATELGLAEERERRRVATELHDYVVQLLAAAKLKLGMIGRTEAAAPYLELLRDVEGILQEALSRSRSLMYELTSSALYEIGFAEAVAALVRQYRDRSGIDLVLHDDEQDKPLEKDVQVMLFQALRELLSNIVTHAQATEAEVDMAREDSSLRITVRDNGVGFDPVAVRAGDQPESGFGLFSIRQRLRHFGGTMQVESAHGKGSTITLVAPLQGATPKGPSAPLQQEALTGKDD